MCTNPLFGPGEAGHLDDDELVAAFESLTLPHASFRHADHVRLGWIYLRRMPLLETIGRYGAGLRRLAASHGVADRYHETVTWALLVIIHERMRRDGDGGSWGAFAAAHPDLLRWRDGPLFERYGPEVLDSPEARAFFVLPGPPSPPGPRRGEP